MLILKTITELSEESFIQNFEEGLFISRQLVQKSLFSIYHISLKLDTIYRHFKLLDSYKKIKYFRGSSWRECFLIENFKKANAFHCIWKKEVVLSKNEIKDVFSKHSKSKLKNIEEEYQNFQDYYKNNGFKFKILRVLKNKWIAWCSRIHPISLDISTLSYLNFKSMEPKIYLTYGNRTLSQEI
jgi:hypothetical protein